ncbi:hypothetical protein EV714DRAFT_240435, partial [Schizophyllum commune]
DVLWKYRLTGMKPLLALMSGGTYQWDLKLIENRDFTVAQMDLHLNTDAVDRALARARNVRDVAFDYRNCVVDLAIIRALAHLVKPHEPLFPSMRSISIPFPTCHNSNFIPHLPASLGVSFNGSMSVNLSIRRLIAAFAYVPNTAVGHIVREPLPRGRELRVHGTHVLTLLDILRAKSSWAVQTLCIRWPQQCTLETARQLIVAIVESCATLSCLELRVDSIEGDEDENWELVTRGLFQTLSGLRDLTQLTLEAPMQPQLSDSDWVSAVRSWPLLERFSIVPHSSTFDCFPDASISRPACTIQAILNVAVACPRLLVLELPGIDGSRIPSATAIQKPGPHAVLDVEAPVGEVLAARVQTHEEREADEERPAEKAVPNSVETGSVMMLLRLRRKHSGSSYL